MIHTQKHNTLKTQADAIIYFLQLMDIEMVSDILDNDRTYQNLDKNIFIQKLGAALDNFLESGDTFLNCHEGFCDSEVCNYKCSGFSFIGNHSNNFIDLIKYTKDGKIKDIYECTHFKSLKNSGLKKVRIILDEVQS